MAWATQRSGPRGRGPQSSRSRLICDQARPSRRRSGMPDLVAGPGEPGHEQLVASRLRRRSRIAMIRSLGSNAAPRPIPMRTAGRTSSGTPRRPARPRGSRAGPARTGDCPPNAGRCYRCRVRLSPPSPAAPGQRQPPAAGRSGPRAAHQAPCPDRRRGARAQRHQHLVGRGAPDVVAVRHVAVEVGPEHQMLAALALIRPGDAHVHHPALVVIIDKADVGAGRQLDHHRARRQVKRARRVRRVGVQREPDLAGGRRAIPDLVVIGETDLPVAVKDPLHRHRWIPGPVAATAAADPPPRAADRRVVQRKARP